MASDKSDSGETTPRTVTETDLISFGCQVGDYSRLHFDKHLSSTLSDSQLVHGLLVASYSLGSLSLEVPELLGRCAQNSVIASYSVNHRRHVYVDDTLKTLWRVQRHADELRTVFQVINQSGEQTTDGEIVLRNNLVSLPAAASPEWSIDMAQNHQHKEGQAALWADDYFTGGQSGETEGRTLTETDVVNYGTLTGDSGAVHFDAMAAANSLYGQRVVQPMLVFNIAFANWLRVWLGLPMPDTGSAGFGGHVADSWEFFRPVYIGDTLRCRYHTLESRRSKSLPQMGVLSFGLQVINQHDEVVQQGKALMLFPARG